MCSQPTGEPRRTNKYVKSAIIHPTEALEEAIWEFMHEHGHGEIEIQSILIQYTDKED